MSAIFAPKAARTSKAQVVASLGGPIADLGGVYADDTADHQGNFCAVQALAACVANLTGNISGTTTAVPIPAGVTIVGLFSKVTLASGKAILYNATTPNL